MKNEATITTLLGITQPEAAMLFRVSLSQWSMYSSGKRDLPLPALQLLGEMLAHLKESEVIAKVQKQIESKEMQKHLERLLRDNEFLQMQLIRKIAANNKNQVAQSRRQTLYDFLVKRDAEKKGEDRLSQVLKMKLSEAPIVVSKNSIEQQHKLELLSFEQTLLESKLQKLRG